MHRQSIVVNFCFSIFACLALAATSFAQSDSPSTASPERNAADTTQNDYQANTVDSKPRLTSKTDFDELARVYTDSYALPHVLFVIDRQENNRIYFINTRRYKFHKEFINATYLSLDRGREFYENNYRNPNRRFLLGTMAYQTPLKKYTFEFNDENVLTPELITLAYKIVGETFFAPVTFKANSTAHEEAAKQLSAVPLITQRDLAREQEYLPLNVGRGIGRIHIIDKLDDTVEIGDNEILILKEVPTSLPRVEGLITTRPSTPLSHLNLLAKSWKIPNAYIKNADQLYQAFDTRWVEFETRPDGFSIKLAGRDQLREYSARQALRRDLMRPQSDLSVRRIAALREQRAASITAYGGKSANLGELVGAQIPGVVVPDGWTIPFYYYNRFLIDNKLDERIAQLLDDNQFIHNPAYRRARLEELRAQIQKAKVSTYLQQAIVRRWRVANRGRGVFVRSSSNTEDLPNFNGAGIYSSVPNVRDATKLVEAVKTVWGSMWNFEAYEARERAAIDHTLSYMAVLVQEGINAESSGVMITSDPYNRDNREAVFIAAKRGLGTRVVDGVKIAEQILYSPATDSLNILTRSEEDSLLTFDARGGLREVKLKTSERTVLTDENVRRLAHVAARIRNLFGGRDQDIEWALMRGQLYIVQSRPYIAGN